MNVRGLGAGVKKRRIRELVRVEKVEVLALQETKVERVDRSFCASLWGGTTWVGVVFLQMDGVVD
jgi:exonuclease III